MATTHAGLVPHIPTELVDRLSKLVGLLGSDFAGERAAAGLKATQLLREHRLSWAEVIQAAGPRASEQPPEPPRRQPQPPDPPWVWEFQLEFCAARPWFLTPWEQRFVAALQRWGKRPSPKQMAVLAGLYLKVTAK